MIWQGWVALSIVAASLLILIFSRIAPHIVLLSAMTLLMVTGILPSDVALAGFANSGLITVAAMFVIAAGIHASGGIELIIKYLLGRPKNTRHAIVRIFMPISILSGFLNNTPVVATMIPAINRWSKSIDIPASKLMIPLSFSAILGGTLTLIGTSTNLIVNSQYQQLTQSDGFSLFAITAIGLPVALLGGLFMWLFFPKMLPNKSGAKLLSNLREFTLEVKVSEQGALVGKSIKEAGLRNFKRSYLVEIERNGEIIGAVSSEEVLKGGDRLVFAGESDAITEILHLNGIEPSFESDKHAVIDRKDTDRTFVEVVVSHHCDVVGLSISTEKFRQRYGAIVLAVARNGERIKGNLRNSKLEVGDTLLLEARSAFVSRQKYNKDFLLVNDLATEPPKHNKASLAWGILIAMISVVAMNWLSMLEASLIAAGAMVALGCCSMAQAEKSLDLSIILTIAASFALGAALQTTGVAHYLAMHVVAFSDGKPWLLLVLTYICVSILTELITNNAAAVLMLPIVVGMCQQAGIDAEPFVIAIMMAASASFATPLGYQTNLMVYGPGGYTFSDFLRVGIPMNVFIGVVTIAMLLLFWM